MTDSAIGPTLRHATDADLAQITELLTASDLPTVGVAEALDGFVVADEGKKIVGVVGVETCCDRYALLRSTAVSPSWRGRGLGRRLVERAVSEAEGRGIDALYLLTTTAETYFPSFGFSTVTRDQVPDEVKASDEFRSACPASATVMMRPLTHAV
jgi:N-acetylglutamate synthase-like GNAT family acetyltransferase